MRGLSRHQERASFRIVPSPGFSPGTESYGRDPRGDVLKNDLHVQLREAIRELCARYPDSYWRDLDAQREYPDAFVRALTEAGYLGALIPEEYGGSGLTVSDASVILEEINHCG